MEQKLSAQVTDWVYRASLSEDEERADKIYRFLVTAFALGAAVVERLQIPAVQEVFQLCRFVGNESHLMTEFLRFVQTPSNVLVSRIGPKNDVLPLISPHFADRLPSENWVIWDENRGKASVHQADKGWFLVSLTAEEEKQISILAGGGGRLRQEPSSGPETGSEIFSVCGEDYEKLAGALEQAAQAADGQDRAAADDGSGRRRSDFGSGGPEVQTKEKDTEISDYSFDILVQTGIPVKRRGVKLSEAEGMVCAGLLIPYPPGIPIACPGEILTRQVIDRIMSARRAGRKVIGVSPEMEILVGAD